MSELDIYSQLVSSVAAELTPRVAALQVGRRGRGGWFATGVGSAVVFTDDGFLLRVGSPRSLTLPVGTVYT